MNLVELAQEIAGCPPSAGIEVRGLARDSRAVTPGDVFVAIPGTQVNGAKFAADAVKRGAVAVVAEHPLPDLGVPVLVTADAAKALGLLAARFHGAPSKDVTVTGVTGTNGKTTTTTLLSGILGAAKRPAALLGTIVNRVAGRETASTMTTPDALGVQQALADCRDAGLTDLVMEVSSHSLDQQRVAGVEFDCAVFTNLTRDHLDYHGTLEAYQNAKARLFENLSPDASCVLNARDPFGRALAARTRARIVFTEWFDGSSRRLAPSGHPSVSARVLSESLQGTRLELSFDGERAELTLPMIGRFNVENALGAAAAAWSLGVSPETIGNALTICPGVPGRLERIGDPSGPTVLVDYAHTPDALERVLETLHPLVPTSGRLLVVFGCGGDRDRGKRAPMARAVERHADLAVLTSDNPRSEDPRQILREVQAGLTRAGGALVIEDRRRAIHTAIHAAGPQDLVLLAGKGHETGQIVGDTILPFDDRQVARQALSARSRRAA